MKVAVFSTKSYDRLFLEETNRQFGHDLKFFEPRLSSETVALADKFPGICVFVNDRLEKDALQALAKQGTRLVALRCAGFNNVDLEAAAQAGITVARVPAYSPYAVAEHTVALLLNVNRKVHRAFVRVREGNFSLDGLLGFDLHGKTVGIVGTGKIGEVVAHILNGFGCRLLAYDVKPNPACEALGVQYTGLEPLFRESDIITLHCPLTPQTHHLINRKTVGHMKSGVTLINTSRGALIDTPAVIEGLKSGKIGYLAIDVYEEEADLFFEDLSNEVMQDDVFARLLTFPNVVVTGHQAFFTRNALQNIAETTLNNIREFEETGQCRNQVTPAGVSG